MTGDYSQVILTLGAAGALLYVLKLIVDGKLHTSSETDGLRQDKADLLRINAKLGEALDKTNDQLKMVIELLTGESDDIP